MQAVTDQKQVDKVVDLAKQYLDRHQPQDYRLEVVPDTVQQEDDWYYIVVQPSRDDVRSYDFSARLAEAEIELQEEQKINILLVPTLPG